MLKADYHIHTNICDGKDSPENMVKAALDKGLTHLGFSGHFDPPVGVKMDKNAYKAEIRRLKEKYAGKIDIFLGGEVDCLYGEGGTEELEYRIGSAHTIRTADGGMFSVDESEEVLQSNCREYFGNDYYALSKAYYETEAKIIERTKPDFIGHFDLVLRFNDSLHYIDEDDPSYLRPALDTMEYLSGQDIIFEINCGAVNRGRKKDFYPDTRLLKALKGFGGRIMINSDAHDKEHICGGFDAAVKKAISCGFTHTNILIHDKGGIAWKELPLDGL